MAKQNKTIHELIEENFGSKSFEEAVADFERRIPFPPTPRVIPLKKTPYKTWEERLEKLKPKPKNEYQSKRNKEADRN